MKILLKFLLFLLLISSVSAISHSGETNGVTKEKMNFGGKAVKVRSLNVLNPKGKRVFNNKPTLSVLPSLGTNFSVASESHLPSANSNLVLAGESHLPSANSNLVLAGGLYLDKTKTNESYPVSYGFGEIDDAQRVVIDDIAYREFVMGFDSNGDLSTMPIPTLYSENLKSSWLAALENLETPLTPVFSNLYPNVMNVYCEAVIPSSVEERVSQKSFMAAAVSNGYNTILVTYYLGDGPAEMLSSVIGDAHSVGAKVILSFGGKDLVPIVMTRFDIDEIKSVLSNCLPSVEYYLPVWRGLSPRHANASYEDFYYEDTGSNVTGVVTYYDKLASVLVQMALKIRPEIPLFGIIEKNSLNPDGDAFFVPENSSAILVIKPISSAKEIMLTAKNYANWQRKNRPILLFGPVCSPSIYTLVQDQNSINSFVKNMNARKLSTFRMHGNGKLSRDAMIKKQSF